MRTMSGKKIIRTIEKIIEIIKQLIPVNQLIVRNNFMNSIETAS